MAVLTVKKGLILQNIFALLPKTNIGRGRDNDIIVLEEYISREHFSILKTNDNYYIDVKSKRGIIFNQNSVSKGKFPLQHGDSIEIGIYEFQFLDYIKGELKDTIDNRYTHSEDDNFLFFQINKNRKQELFLFKKSIKTYFENYVIHIDKNSIKINDKIFDIDQLPYENRYLDIKFKLFDKKNSFSVFKNQPFYGFYSVSEKMISQYLHIWISSHSDFSIFIHGETGTGKDVMARAIHKISKRSGKFIPINCASIPENLWESELFGHVKGAFTGADRTRSGAFQEADKGTIFLDEIAEMPLEQQAKLLRVLETAKVKKVGSDKEEKIDIRIICATHKNIFEMVQKGEFREDLFHRIYIFPITLPPIRDRRIDIPLYVDLFIKQLNDKMGYKKTITTTAMELLTNYFWPGNVRELKNTLERGYLLSAEDDITTKTIFFFSWKKSKGLTLDEIIDQAILDSLVRNNFSRRTTYEELKISRSRLYRWMEEHKNLLKGFING